MSVMSDRSFCLENCAADVENTWRIHNNQKLETTQMTMDMRADKQWWLFPYTYTVQQFKNNILSCINEYQKLHLSSINLRKCAYS